MSARHPVIGLSVLIVLAMVAGCESTNGGSGSVGFYGSYYGGGYYPGYAGYWYDDDDA